MRGLVQRVREAAVTSAPSADAFEDVAEETGRIGRGILLLVGVTHDDDQAAARRLAEKSFNLRIFPDPAGAMNASCADIGGEVLVVPQFTLYGETRRGRRPSFVEAAGPAHAEELVDRVVAELRSLGAVVASGRFRTHMRVSLVNDGPVTLMLET